MRRSTTWTELQAAIVAAGAGPATFTVKRDGSTVTLDPDLVTVPRPVLDDAGKQTAPSSARSSGWRRQPSDRRSRCSAVPSTIWSTTTKAVGTILTLPVRVYDLVRVVASDQPRDPEGIIGVVGVGRLTGDVIAMPDTPVLDKAATVVGSSAA